ncbi:MAG: 50S ribosomal protein L5 [Chlorobi bacterium]|nr:50S ribosomal protein L5 [Chlorobiota bacterium]
MEKRIPTLKKKFKEEITPSLQKEFKYSSVMQVPRLEKIVLNQGIGQGVADKKVITTAQEELSVIAGQHAIQRIAKNNISNFKLREGMPIGVSVTLRKDRMYEFLEKLLVVAIPRIKDFNGISNKFDGRGNYTLGIEEQFIFPEIELDKIDKILGMNITFVTSAKTDEEGYALLKHFGFPFKK